MPNMGGGRGRRIATAGLLLLCYILVITGHVVASQGDEATCSDGTCPSDPVGGIIHQTPEGITTLGAATYPPSHGYGYKITRHLEKIRNSATFLDRLEAQRHEPPSQHRTEAMRQSVLEITLQLVEDGLMQLAMLHRDEWTQVLFEPPLELDAEEEIRKHHAYATDHFDKAINAYEVLLDVYARLWEAMSPGEFSLYDREAMSSGRSSVYVLMADMYHSRYNQRLDDDASAGDCTVAYRHLIQAEVWCETSLTLLKVDLEDQMHSLDGVRADEHMAIVEEVKQSMALVQVRLGALLVDMYVAGYVLDANGNLRLEPPVALGHSVDMEALLGADQKRILDMTMDKLKRGSQLYTQLAAENPSGMDYRLNIADSGHYVGVVYSHLLQWTDAASALERSMSLYEEILEEYLRSGWIPESLEVANGMIQTTQSLWEAYLNLHGKTNEAEIIFRRHLVLRRYSEREVPFDEPLEDAEDSGGAHYSSHGAGDILYQTYDGGTADDFQESLKTYQKLLDDYMQEVSEYPPDGSYYEMGFDAYDGIGANSYVQHDKIYEGTMRSSIGSLHLAQNTLVVAKAELELAVGLLRDGLGEGRESFDAYGENEELIQYSVRLELANALLNLAYAELGLKHWRSSLEAFEQAMELFDAELAENETPMNHSGGADRGQGSTWGERLTSFFKTGSNEEATGSGNEDAEANAPIKVDANRGIDLANFQMMENITATVIADE